MDKKKLRRILVFWLKAILSGLAIYYVTGKIDLIQLALGLRSLQYAFFIPAIALFALSKLFSVFKTDLIMRNTGTSLNLSESLRLYWIGMFYNQFLPGGIGGDTYKVLLLRDGKQVHWRTGIGIMLNDRISGIIALLVLVAVFYYLVGLNGGLNYFIWVSIPLFPLVYYLFLARFYSSYKRSFIGLMTYSMCVQSVQFLVIVFLMLSTGQPGDFVPCLLIFGVSSIAANLPVSIGGIGIREMVFLEGAHYFGLVPELAVLLSMLFYFISFLVALPGIIWVFQSPFHIAPAKFSAVSSQ